MKKSELLKLKSQYASQSMMRAARNDVPKRRKSYWGKDYVDEYKTGFYMRGKNDNGIIRIAVFLTENMRLGSNSPAFEIFIDKEKRDFITYDYKHSKWSQARISLLTWPQYHYCSGQYNNRDFNKFIKKALGTEKGGYDGILEWQTGVRSEQLKARHKKETDPWDAEMDKVLKEPADWERWVDKCGITQNFIFYQYVRGGAKTGYCSWCEKEVDIKNPKHNGVGKCRRCGHEIQYKSIGKAGTVVTDSEKAYLMQKYGGGFIVRQYNIYKKYPNGSYKSPKICIFEERRVIFDSELNGKAYYYGLYKQTDARWIYGGDAVRSGYAWYSRAQTGNVYKRTVPSLERLLERTGLPEMIRGQNENDPEVYLAELKQIPYIEQLAKAGLTRLVSDIIFDYHYRDFKFENMRGLGRSLMIDKNRLGRLREYNGGMRFLEWLRFEKNSGKKIDDDVIKWLSDEHISPDEINFIADRMSERQIMNYVKRQQQDISLSAKEIISMWEDYLKMAARAKMNVNDEIVYRAKKLQQRHDELVKRLGSKALAIRAGEIALKFPDVDTVCKELKDRYEFENDKYAVLVPENIEDILGEGQTLNHCIDKTDRYFERIHTRESYLLFLRKKEDVSKPWYTLEVEPDGTVRQKRTEYNRQNKDLKEAEGFLREWQKFVRGNLTCDDLKSAEESRNLRIKEFEEMRKNGVRISHGHLSGELLADVLEKDLMENNPVTEDLKIS